MKAISKFFAKLENGDFNGAYFLKRKKNNAVKRLILSGKKIPTTFDCPHCQGGVILKKVTYKIKKAKCFYCQGTGKKTYTCKRCKGQGCSDCNYTGKKRTPAPCPKCNHGMVILKTPEASVFEECPECMGWGIKSPFLNAILAHNIEDVAETITKLIFEA